MLSFGAKAETRTRVQALATPGDNHYTTFASATRRPDRSMKPCRSIFSFLIIVVPHQWGLTAKNNVEGSSALWSYFLHPFCDSYHCCSKRFWYFIQNNCNTDNIVNNVRWISYIFTMYPIQREPWFHCRKICISASFGSSRLGLCRDGVFPLHSNLGYCCYINSIYYRKRFD